MAAEIIDGRACAENIYADLKPRVDRLRQAGLDPQLVGIQVGENAASEVYVRNQQKQCHAVGLRYTPWLLDPASTQAEVLNWIDSLNHEADVTGIILQMPLPHGLDARTIQWRIDPLKDVEGVNPANMGYIVYGQPRHALAPCTAMAVWELIRFAGVKVAGREVCVVGHSNIVGKPATLLLLNEFGTTTTCHVETQNLKAHTVQADILVVAVGKPRLITADMIKPGATVIDVGINRIFVVDEHGRQVLNKRGKPKKRSVGDVDFDAAVQVAGAITPVPGGVGPVTTAMLLRNTVLAAELQLERRTAAAGQVNNGTS